MVDVSDLDPDYEKNFDFTNGESPLPNTEKGSAREQLEQLDLFGDVTVCGLVEDEPTHRLVALSVNAISPDEAVRDGEVTGSRVIRPASVWEAHIEPSGTQKDSSMFANSDFVKLPKITRKRVIGQGQSRTALQRCWARTSKLLSRMLSLERSNKKLLKEVHALQKQVDVLEKEVTTLNDFCFVFGSAFATMHCAEITLNFLGRPMRMHKPANHAAHAWKQGPEFKIMLNNVLHVPGHKHSVVVNTMDSVIHERHLLAHTMSKNDLTMIIQALKANRGKLNEKQKLVLKMLQHADAIAPKLPGARGFGLKHGRKVPNVQKATEFQ